MKNGRSQEIIGDISGRHKLSYEIKMVEVDLVDRVGDWSSGFANTLKYIDFASQPSLPKRCKACNIHTSRKTQELLQKFKWDVWMPPFIQPRFGAQSWCQTLIGITSSTNSVKTADENWLN
ncbi:hypothetical protein AVEN_3921-1 [Araneus ventricosus]|uniref:Uncharacterized protein n=1 Tax=Araneus ventricosus TaxID=182803 RepID=A0A4Y2IGQ2_ARAVE|nr:hypothetical protein AVEN_3921-1 [Araneus ventricosus]